MNWDYLRQLPTFHNHIEAKDYFKTHYGNQFIDTKITHFNLDGKQRKHYCQIKLGEKQFQALKIAEDGTVEFIDKKETRLD